MKRFILCMVMSLFMLSNYGISDATNAINTELQITIKNNLLSISAKDVESDKIIREIENKASVKIKIFKGVKHKKVTIDIANVPLYEIGSVIKNIGYNNSAIVYDGKQKALLGYILPPGKDISPFIKNSSLIKPADFAGAVSGNSTTDKALVKGNEIVTISKSKVPIRYIKNEVVLKPAPYLSDSEIKNALKKYNLTQISSPSLEKIGYVKAKLPDNRKVEDVLRVIRKEHYFVKSEPNYVLNFLAVSDPLSSYQEYIQETGFNKAWDLVKNVNQVKVAVIDSGVNSSHPDLKGNIINGYDFYNNDTDPSDDNGHGTFVTGIIAALNNDIGIKGLYYKAQVIPVKVIGPHGLGTYEDTGSGIIWATDAGAKVINLSIGGYGYSYMLRDAVDYALGNGCVVVAAGGNEGVSKEIYPAGYPDVIGVSALGADREIWSDSNSGAHIDVCAPGQMILSTGIGGEYVYASGTSASSAMVSALAAMLFSENPDLSNAYLSRLITQTALDLGNKGRDSVYGAGLIDAAAALGENIAPFHDLGVRSVDIETMILEKGKPVYIFTDIVNVGTYPLETCDVELYEISGKDKNKKSVDKKSVNVKGVERVYFEWNSEEIVDDVQFEVVVVNKDDARLENNVRRSRWFYMTEEDGVVYIKHKSEPNMQVHQFYAGEASKIWPGRNSGTIWEQTVTIHKIKYENYSAIWPSDEDIYFKFYVNDKFALLNDFGQYYHQDAGQWIDINHELTVTVNEYDILSIGIIGMDKEGGFGAGIDEDEPIGKIHFIKTASESWGNGTNLIVESSEISDGRKIIVEYSIVTKTTQTITDPNSDPKAQEEINKRIGTRLVLDGNIDGEEKFYATYSGNIDEGLFIPDQNSSLKSSYLYYKQIPYSDFDIQVYENDVEQLCEDAVTNELDGTEAMSYVIDGLKEEATYLNGGNNDIIEGTHEEDMWYPDLKPDEKWANSIEGYEAPYEDSYYISDLSLSHVATNALVFFENHFWEPDIYANGSFGAGGSALLIGASAYHRAQLYWDYYVLPLYMGYNIPEENIETDEQKIDRAYYYLGRITHLLEDMGAIEHVHRDPHPIDTEYEEEIGEKYVHGKVEDGIVEVIWDFNTPNSLENKCVDFNDVTKYTDNTDYEYTPFIRNNNPYGDQSDNINDDLINEYKGKFEANKNPKSEWDSIQTQDTDWPQGWNAEEATTQWNEMTPLFKIFYSMAETTDNYPSDDYDGDFISENEGEYIINDWIDAHWDEAGDDIIPKMMSHVAGLYRLFWVSTHFPTKLENYTTYSEYLEDNNSSISTKMRESYVRAFESQQYLGSPTGDCLVVPFTELDSNGISNITGYYRSYNHGGLFYNHSKEECFFLGEGIWKKWLELDDATKEGLGLPISNEYVADMSDFELDVSESPVVDFEGGRIYWDGDEAHICITPNYMEVIVDNDLNNGGSEYCQKYYQSEGGTEQNIASGYYSTARLVKGQSQEWAQWKPNITGNYKVYVYIPEGSQATNLVYKIKPDGTDENEILSDPINQTNNVDSWVELTSSGQDTFWFIPDGYIGIYLGNTDEQNTTNSDIDENDWVAFDAVKFEYKISPLKFRDSPTVYFYSNDYYWPILDEKTYALLGFNIECTDSPEPNFSLVNNEEASEKSKYEDIIKDNSVLSQGMPVKIVDQIGPNICKQRDSDRDPSKVYIFDCDKFRPVENEELYLNLGMEWSDIVGITQSLFNEYGEAYPIDYENSTLDCESGTFSLCSYTGTIYQEETITTPVLLANFSPPIQFNIEWDRSDPDLIMASSVSETLNPSSDLDLIITTPSGEILTPSSEIVTDYYEGETQEYYIINSSEEGTWNVDIVAIDVDPAGEDYTLTISVADSNTTDSDSDDEEQSLPSFNVPGDFDDIQSAITAANSEGGGIILLNEGTYYENITLKDGVWLIAEGDPANTVIDGAGNNNVVEIDGVVETGGIIGVTIQNSASNGNFAGIKCVGNESPVIMNCIIKNNNHGIRFGGDAKPFIANNLVINNTGKGIYSNGNAPGTVINNIIINNGECGISGNGKDVQLLAYNNVWNNGPDGNLNYDDRSPGQGDISADPLFEDIESDDFHLTENSPCIDTGHPDILDNDNSRSDMGIYGANTVDLCESSDIASSGSASLDTDKDGVPNLYDDSPDNAAQATPNTATGKGKFKIDASSNEGVSIQEAKGLSDTDESLVQTGKPDPNQYKFEHGILKFKVKDFALGSTVEVEIGFPETLPDGSKCFKVDDNGFYEFPEARIEGDKVILPITDGGKGDADGLVNGEIDDPVGVAVPSDTDDTTDSEDNDSGGCLIDSAGYGSFHEIMNTGKILLLIIGIGMIAVFYLRFGRSDKNITNKEVKND